MPALQIYEKKKKKMKTSSRITFSERTCLSDLDGQDKKNYLLQFVGLTKLLNVYNLAKLINIHILLTMLKPEELNGHIFVLLLPCKKKYLKRTLEHQEQFLF